VAERLEPREAARLCAQAARILAEALAREKSDVARMRLAGGLAALATWMEPQEAARLCAEAASLLTQELAHRDYDEARMRLADGLAALARRMEPREAARLCAQAARILAEALARGTSNDDARGRLGVASGLAALAAWMEPRGGARLLTQALAQEKESGARKTLVAALADVATRLEPKEARRASAEAARICLSSQHQERDVAARHATTELLARLIQPRDDDGSVQAARVCARWVVASPELFCGTENGLPRLPRRSELLGLFLIDSSRPKILRRAAAAWASVGLSAPGLALNLPLLQAASEPLPCRLDTQDLVELLKMPTCTRDVRRVVLDHLGNRFGRRFQTHWDFVRFAHDQRLDLDFTSPPKRPSRKLPPLFAE
jgi:hypothetical protein